MIDKQDILQVALSIKPHLHRLMPEQDARKMDTDLGKLLERFDFEPEIENLVLARLTDQDNIREWVEITFQLNTERGAISKGFESVGGNEGLAGDPRPVNASKYVCPILGCGFDYYLNRVGRPMPPCPFHRVPLIPVDG